VNRHSSVRAVGIAVAVSVAIGLLVSWFAWPAKELAPRDLPVVVAGPAPAATAFADRLHQARPGAFDVSLASDAGAADAALRDRLAYAAFLIGPDGVSLHTASGASPTVAALLTSAVQELSGGRPVTAVDVVPGSPADPRGAGFAAGFLPLVLAGMLAGILLALVVPAKGARLIGLGTVAVLAGAVGAGVLSGLDVLTGPYLAEAGVLAVLTLAISATVAGLASLLGRVGIGLGVLTVFLFANPISAVAAAPELLPQPWGAIGQFLPPGAGATLLRSAAFFDGAGSAAALWTLITWAAAGLVLLALGRARTGITKAA
jgi:hypothetical protein